MEGQTKTFPEHDCYAWNRQIWHNQGDCNYITCGVCGKITHFRWKSFWKGLRFLLWDKVSGDRFTNA